MTGSTKISGRPVWLGFASRTTQRCSTGLQRWACRGVQRCLTLAQHTAGSSVRSGFFPDILGERDLFDAICFNDVLEHLPDVRLALAACYQHLKPGGLLSINIPNSRGLVYRVGVVARRLGLSALFDRLWQLNLPSPHLWYFDEAALSALCTAAGLEPVFAGRLPSITRKGLWQRAHEDRRPSATTVLGVLLAWVAAPVLNNRLASDIMHVIARRPADVKAA